MKFELKTEKDNLSKPIFFVFFTFTTISFVIIILSISFKLGKISNHYEINYLCKLLTVDKSSDNFKKLSKLSKQTSKQKIWDLCIAYLK